jgi:hypothetical protein
MNGYQFRLIAAVRWYKDGTNIIVAGDRIILIGTMVSVIIMVTLLIIIVGKFVVQYGMMIHIAATNISGRWLDVRAALLTKVS